MISGAPRSSSRLKAVVAVDDAAVQVVQVGRREAATVELHHRADVWRDDRDAVQDHAARAVGGVEERHDDAEPLERAGLLLALAAADRLAERLGLGGEVEVLDERLQRLGAHAAGEVVAEAVAQLAVELLVGDQLLGVELAEGVEHLVEPVELPLRLDAQLVHLPLGGVADLALRVALGALGLEGGDVVLELLGAVLDVAVARVLEPLLLDAHAGLDRRQVFLPLVLVHGRDQVRREVDDLLEVLRRQVEQVAEARRDALEVPDVGDRGGELDVAHPLTTDLGPRDLDTAALADDALEADALVLAAVALPVPGGTEDLLAEQAVLLGLERAVVDRLRLLDLAVGPGADVVGGRQTDAQLVEEVDVEHGASFFAV